VKYLIRPYEHDLTLSGSGNQLILTDGEGRMVNTWPYVPPDSLSVSSSDESSSSLSVAGVAEFPPLPQHYPVITEREWVNGVKDTSINIQGYVTIVPNHFGITVNRVSENGIYRSVLRLMLSRPGRYSATW